MPPRKQKDEEVVGDVIESTETESFADEVTVIDEQPIKRKRKTKSQLDLVRIR